MVETQFLSFFILLLTAVFFSTIFTRFHLSWVVALMFGGIVVGPNVLDIFHPDNTITFMSEIGLIFLMFMAGLETKSGKIKENLKKISVISSLNGIIPAIVGFLIGQLLGLDITTSIIISIAFISSSVAVVIPSLTSNKILGTKLGNTIVGSTMIQDVASLILLSILFQSTDNIANLPLPLFYIFLVLSLVVIRKVLILTEKYLVDKGSFNQEFRVTIFVLIGTVALFEILGLHAIIAGFFAGFVLSDTIKHEALKEKLHAIGYGLFIPIFFVMVGFQTDLSAFNGASGSIILISSIVIGSILSKLISGYIAARISGFEPSESKLISASSTPQLSTTLAIAFTASTMGLISPEVTTALICLSIVSTLVGPALIKLALTN